MSPSFPEYSVIDRNDNYLYLYRSYLTGTLDFNDFIMIIPNSEIKKGGGVVYTFGEILGE